MAEENQMYMHVQVTMLKYVTETWRFPIDKDVNPKKIFEEIKKDPQQIWLDYDADLWDSEDYDETIQSVDNFEVDT